MFETLYTIRHPEAWAADIGELDNESGLSDDDLDAEAEELLKYALNNKGVYVPLPGRAEGAEKLIKLTVEVAQALELNVDIERYDDQVVFRFYDALDFYLFDLRKFFGKMFLACDFVTLHLPKEGKSPLPGFHWIITFSYHTHSYMLDEERDTTLE